MVRVVIRIDKDYKLEHNDRGLTERHANASQWKTFKRSKR